MEAAALLKAAHSTQMGVVLFCAEKEQQRLGDLTNLRFQVAFLFCLGGQEQLEFQDLLVFMVLLGVPVEIFEGDFRENL